MILAYFNMNCRVVAGKVTFNWVHSIKIEETIKELGNKAIIELPRNFRTLNGKPILDYIKEGDQITVELGYNGKLQQEFKGYIAIVDAEIPLTLHCDDEFYPLKQNNWVKAYKSVTLKQLLHDIVTGYEIECPDMNMGKYEIDNASTFEVLRKIQQDFGLFMRISEKTFTVGFSYDWVPGKTGRWIYHRQKNVRKSKLVWKRKADQRTRIKVEYWDGKKKKVHYVGSPGNGTKTIKAVGIGAGKDDAHKVGESILSKSVYDGFTGSLTGFGEPRTHAGDTIVYQNVLEPEKQGEYLIDKVTIEFNDSGFSRDNNLGHILGKIDSHG